MNVGIFGNSFDNLTGTLKDPNKLNSAYIYNEIASKNPIDIGKFIQSKEAKTLYETGVINESILDMLKEKADIRNKDPKQIMFGVCHLAKENADILWNELADLRIQEASIMKELLNKYGEKAKALYSEYEDSSIRKIINKNF